MATAFSVPELNFDLLARYGVSGPRYTSYPTAPQFTDTFTESDLSREIEYSDQSQNPPPLSLYFHLPFCESVCFYCGCNVTFTADRSRPAAYLKTLSKEMDMARSHLSAKRQAVQLHWGGGTPTFFAPAELGELISMIKERFSFAPDSELGIEVDPRETNAEHLRVLGSAGFNRLSVGIQDFDPEVQKAVNRIQSEEQTRAVIEEGRANGMNSVSVDLMYGLPKQNRDSFVRTLDKVLALSPDRLALFNFAYLPEMIRHQKAIKVGELPAPQEKLAIFRCAVEKMLAAGYVYIGMDHFAKATDDLCVSQREGKLYRNFQGYSTHAGCDLLAFGVSSISSLGRIYSQNHKNIHQYTAAVEAGQLPVSRGLRLSDDDMLRREVIMRLMCDFELDLRKMEQQFKIDFGTYFASSLSALKQMEQDGLLTVSTDKISISPTGRFLIRNIAMCFDAYLKDTQHRFSKTI